jgi:Flp pilus assembly protein TadD
MFAVEKGLEPAVLDWFETHLRKAPATPPPASAAVKPTLVEKFWSALAEPGGAARAREMYDAARGRKEKVVLFPEGEMNLQGYQLLQEGRTTDALVVFQMNVDEYPRSANVYDSLSDAQLAAGNKADALRNAEKALEVLASDTRVPDQLRAAIKESAEKKIRDLKK